MKMFIAFVALVAVAVAAPQQYQQHQQPQEVVLTKNQELDNIGVGGYSFGFEQSDGQARSESATVVHAGTEHESLVVTGSYRYVDPTTQQLIQVDYTADENGFHPVGAHIPA